jgi:hypothetical protein
MDIVESIIFGQFGYPIFEGILPYITNSIGITNYMVGNLILRPFQWYM